MKNIILGGFVYVLGLTNIQAQPYLKVCNSNNESLGYATINGNTYTILICNKEGLANIVNIKNQSFVVTNIGYENKEVENYKNLVKNNDTFTIILNKLVKTEHEVTVVSKTKTEFFGKVAYNKSHTFRTTNTVHAVRIENPKAYQKILSIFIHITNTKVTNNELIRFRLFAVDSITGKPGKEITTENIIFDAYKKGKWNEFDISKYNIVIKENAFYVGVQTFSDEVNYAPGKENSFAVQFSYAKKSTVCSNYIFTGEKNWNLYKSYDIKDKTKYINPAIYVKSKVPY